MRTDLSIHVGIFARNKPFEKKLLNMTVNLRKEVWKLVLFPSLSEMTEWHFPRDSLSYGCYRQNVGWNFRWQTELITKRTVNSKLNCPRTVKWGLYMSFSAVKWTNMKARNITADQQQLLYPVTHTKLLNRQKILLQSLVWTLHRYSKKWTFHWNEFGNETTVQ